MRNADGSWDVSRTHRDREGNVTDSTSWHFPPLNRTLDPDAAPVDGDLARRMAHYYHGASQGAPIVTHVNPGPQGATPEPTGPRLDPGDDLATDPRLEEATQAREVDAETARRLRGTMVLPVHVNPPGPED